MVPSSSAYTLQDHMLLFLVHMAVAITLCTEGYWFICNILITYFSELTVPAQNTQPKSLTILWVREMPVFES
jgi:hypothetical protein